MGIPAQSQEQNAEARLGSKTEMLAAIRAALGGAPGAVTLSPAYPRLRVPRLRGKSWSVNSAPNCKRLADTPFKFRMPAK
jgi:hypothetical protein